MKNKLKYIATLFLLTSCTPKGVYYVNKKTTHDVSHFEDCSLYGIKEIYYPKVKNICSFEWTIYDSRNKEKIIAKNEITENGCIIYNFWNNGKLKEVRKIENNKIIIVDLFPEEN